MSTNLKEGKAIVTAEGILQENTLKVEDINGVEQISGNIILKVSDTNSITFNVRQAAKIKNKRDDGSDDNKSYPGLVTVMNDYKSIAKDGEEAADIVRISNGQIRPSYMVRSDREGIFYQSNFFNRVVRGESEPNFHADFEIELYVDAVVPELYKDEAHAGEETGRAIVKGWLPTYSGIEPITLIAPKEDGIAEAVMDIYTPGCTATFYGNIVNSRITKTSVIPVRIGKPKETTSTTYVNELVITGASDPYEENAFDREAVRLAIQERASRIEQQKAQTQNGNANNRNTGATGFTPAPSGRQLPF